MLTFKQFITEIFNSHLPFTKKKQGKYEDNDHTYHFHHKGDKYAVNFHHYHQSAHVDFHKVKHTDDEHGPDFRASKDKGHESHHVLSTVAHIIKHHQQKHKVNVTFQADKGDGPSRAKLYDRMVKRAGGKSKDFHHQRHYEIPHKD